MAGDPPPKPDLPNYVVDPLESQSPERLDAVAEYAAQLAEYRRAKRAAEAERRREAESITDAERAALEERGVSTDPADYEDVPASGAYVTVKTTKETGDRSYRYYYWQWRDGDTWKNEYIAPVNPRE